MFFRSLLYEKFKNHFNPNYILEKKINFLELNEENLQNIRGNFEKLNKVREEKKIRKKKKKKKMIERRVKTERDKIPSTSLTLNKEQKESSKRFSTYVESNNSYSSRHIKKQKSGGISSCVNFSNAKTPPKPVPQKPVLVLPPLEQSVTQYLSSRELYSISQSKRSINQLSSVYSQIHADIVDEDNQSQLQIVKKNSLYKPLSFRRKRLSSKASSKSIKSDLSSKTSSE
jgi:hypothetical protein